MHPDCFSIDRLSIHCYGVMMALGFMAGLANWAALAGKHKRSFNFLSDLLFWIMISGILGARLAYVVSNYKEFLAEPLTIVRVDLGGLIYYGGFVGAGLGLFMFAKVRREKIWAITDLVITSVPLAHAFGRIGCFLNGCCHGKVYDGLLGVSYPAGSPAWAVQVHIGQVSRSAGYSLPVHPVQLYEAACNLCIYFLLIWAYRRRKRDGFVTALYLLTYPVARFWTEFLRGDESHRTGSPLSTHLQHGIQCSLRPDADSVFYMHHMLHCFQRP